ncbi:unnamed protein product [Mytilus coruscus]|uniref:Peptidase A2 domain-containing protein n=1 Tax=Mytilus coruscus TaxID=42192 RepID=A0A6J8AEP7_MYTCO|nr:unnamed protein product [Mytilus coruscus]
MDRGEQQRITVLTDTRNLTLLLPSLFLALSRQKHLDVAKLVKEREETIDCYVSRLRKKAHDCEFGNTTEERILEHCIQSIVNKELIRKAISKGWVLDRFIEEAAQVEDTNLQMKEMRKEEVVYKVQNTFERRFDRRQDNNRKRQTMETNNQHSHDFCNYCGFRHESRRCPAYGKDCRSCGIKNHFESMCRLRNKEDSKYQQSRGGMMQNRNRKNVRKTVENNFSEDPDQYDEDDHFDESVKDVAKIGKVKSVCRISDDEKTVKIHLGDVEMKVEPDSGADVNIMDEHQTLQNSLPVKGEFKTIVRNATCGMETKFIVILGRINSPPLLSRATLNELGMMV